jgi:hypothetical protein
MSNDLRRKSAEARELEKLLDQFEMNGGKIQRPGVVESNRSGGSETWFDMGEAYKASVQKGIAKSNDVRRLG